MVRRQGSQFAEAERECPLHRGLLPSSKGGQVEGQESPRANLGPGPVTGQRAVHSHACWEVRKADAHVYRADVRIPPAAPPSAVRPENTRLGRPQSRD